MADEKTPEHLSKDDLDKVKGGYSVWIGGSLKDDGTPRDGITASEDQSPLAKPKADGIHGMETGFGGKT